MRCFFYNLVRQYTGMKKHLVQRAKKEKTLLSSTLGTKHRQPVPVTAQQNPPCAKQPKGNASRETNALSLREKVCKKAIVLWFVNSPPTNKELALSFTKKWKQLKLFRRVSAQPVAGDTAPYYFFLRKSRRR